MWLVLSGAADSLEKNGDVYAQASSREPPAKVMDQINAGTFHVGFHQRFVFFG